MATPSVPLNVARYTALIGGILYGISHRRSLVLEQELQRKDHEYKRQEKLIAQAKLEWKKKQAPETSSGGSRVISDPEDPNFDFEKFILKVEADS